MTRPGGSAYLTPPRQTGSIIVPTGCLAPWAAEPDSAVTDRDTMDGAEEVVRRDGRD